MASSDVRLDGGEAPELAELLSFLGDWLLSDDEGLAASLGRLIDRQGYDTVALRADLARFTFLLNAVRAAA